MNFEGMCKKIQEIYPFVNKSRARNFIKLVNQHNSAPEENRISMLELYLIEYPEFKEKEHKIKFMLDPFQFIDANYCQFPEYLFILNTLNEKLGQCKSAENKRECEGTVKQQANQDFAHFFKSF